jgi:hypothetical protein
MLFIAGKAKARLNSKGQKRCNLDLIHREEIWGGSLLEPGDSYGKALGFHVLRLPKKEQNLETEFFFDEEGIDGLWKECGLPEGER